MLDGNALFFCLPQSFAQPREHGHGDLRLGKKDVIGPVGESGTTQGSRVNFPRTIQILTPGLKNEAHRHLFFPVLTRGKFPLISQVLALKFPRGGCPGGALDQKSSTVIRAVGKMDELKTQEPQRAPLKLKPPGQPNPFSYGPQSAVRPGSLSRQRTTTAERSSDQITQRAARTSVGTFPLSKPFLNRNDQPPLLR
jgi:hypothetical protein